MIQINETDQSLWLNGRAACLRAFYALNDLTAAAIDVRYRDVRGLNVSVNFSR
jgi:hypothetical protein